MLQDKLTSREVCESLGVPRGSLYVIRRKARVDPQKEFVRGRGTDIYTAEQVEAMRPHCGQRRQHGAAKET
jgi:hypothetical protein